MTSHNGPDDEKWLGTLYSLAHSNIRWAKEQGWRVLGWYMALAGSIVTLYKYPLSNLPAWIFVKLTIALTLLAMWFLWNLNEASRGARNTSVRIEGTLTEKVLPLNERSVAGGQYEFMLIQWAVVLVTCAIVIYAVVHMHSGTSPTGSPAT